MSADAFYHWGVVALLALAPIVFVSLQFLAAPYGRHARAGWGPTVPARLGWVIMELPSSAVFAWVYFRGEGAFDTVSLIFLALYQAHYLQRTFVFPLLMRAKGKRNPLAPILLSIVFNVVNGALNALAVSHIHRYADAWLGDPRFVAGVLLFGAGMVVNLHSDSILRRLRGPGETGYKIPRGGLFRWVSSPNYLGEIIEWCGWALATWSGAGLAFALFTFANLAPRGATNHAWYRERFPDYPPERRAVIPGLW